MNVSDIFLVALKSNLDIQQSGRIFCHVWSFYEWAVSDLDLSRGCIFSRVWHFCERALRDLDSTDFCNKLECFVPVKLFQPSQMGASLG